MYNDLSGSDEIFLTRNAIIGIAYMLYGSGALRVSAAFSTSISQPHTLNSTGYLWSFLIGLLIFSTMSIQDLKDIEGDRLRNRKTAPLILNDRIARWLIAGPVAFWSIFCPLFWGVWIVISFIPFGLGSWIAWRVVMGGGVARDSMTWKIWSAWLATIYFLPVVKYYVG